MPTEIERKFLVRGDEWRTDTPKRYRQGYLTRDRERSVRVRLIEDKGGERGFLTVKGVSRGAARAEYEYAIPPTDAREMLDSLCLRPLIEKARHRVHYGGLLWEIDEFFGDNAGLIMAEVELKDEAQEVPMPPWIDREVTGNPNYFNSNLSRHPYREWSEAEKNE